MKNIRGLTSSVVKFLWLTAAAIMLGACYDRASPPIRSASDARAWCPASFDFNSYSYLSKIDVWGMISPGPDGVWVSSRLDFKQSYEMTDQMQRFWRLWNQGMSARGVDYTVAILPQRGLLVDYSAYAPPTATPVGGYDRFVALDSYRTYLARWPVGGPRLIDLYSTVAQRGNAAYHPRDHHWTQETAAAAAMTVAGRLKRVPTIANLPTHPYPMRTGDVIDLGVSFQDNILRECAIRYPNNPGIEYRTQGPDAGFGPGQYVSVIGNSNTNSLQGFDEWLRHSLKHPVEDNHVPGHHMHWSMFNLVHNEMNAQGRAPAAAIQVLSTWERGFDEIQGSHYELIAALNGQCSEEEAEAVIAPTFFTDGTAAWRIPSLPSGLYYAQVRFSKNMKIEDRDLALDPPVTPAARNFEYLVAKNSVTNRVFRFGRTSFDSDHAMNSNLYLPLFGSSGETWEWLDQPRNPLNENDQMYVCKARYAL